MWIVELSFTGGPDRIAARKAHRQLLAQLHDNGVVRLAGPLGDDSGALIVYDVPDRTSVERLMANDPYFTTTGVIVSNIREWRPFLT